MLITFGSYVAFMFVCRQIENTFFYKLETAHEIEIFKAAIARPLIDAGELIRMVIVTAIPLSIKMMRRYGRINAEKSNLIKLNTELELNFLKAQINPHFLFNSLNNIYALALQKSDRSPEMILKLSDLMRYMLYEYNVPLINLDRELKFLNDYIDLEKIRHGEKAKINFTLSGETLDKQIPPLLLIPFVENAFKHGINAQFNSAWVNVDMKLDTPENDFIFTISNNKPLVPEKKQQAAGGIGIENAKKRLEMIYPNKHTLSIDSPLDTFIVSLIIPKL